MTERVKELLRLLKSKEHKKQREHTEQPECGDLYDVNHRAEYFEKILEHEKPIIFENDRIGFNRSDDCTIASSGGNVTPDYYYVISNGFDKITEEIRESRKKHPENSEYANALLRCIDAAYKLADKYKTRAKELGNKELYNALCHIPHKGANSFYEACVFLKLSIFLIRMDFANHITLGRFDQYMYSFYLKDKERGVSDEEIFEIIEEFFISINFDTDLYFGFQQGDNGQSMVLGGFDREGKSMFNELSKMCMDASMELLLIDPKINLRVGKNTPNELFEYATHMTKKGLGFPQYCNDDVVVPGLVKLGYDIDDALDYTVAACWEFIIPGKGADIPNIETMDFPHIVSDVITEKLEECDTFSELLDYIKNAIQAEYDRKIESRKSFKNPPLPLCSIYMNGCINTLADMYNNGVKYTNFGCHGAGIANAADALAAVKKAVYDDKTVDKKELLCALSNNFEGYAKVRNILKSYPKMGNNDDYVDDIAIELMSEFANDMNNRDNGCGGIWRAGTGSAMEYIWKGEKCPATADGRLAHTPYSSSYSPSLDANTNGLLSVFKSFTKFDLTNIINGGPMTIEIHDTVLKNEIGIKKTALLVKKFIELGGHQLQLNSVNREKLLDAQKHPENYPNLIVRVWGWSGYFNELDLKYQNHIIRRCEYVV